MDNEKAQEFREVIQDLKKRMATFDDLLKKLEFALNINEDNSKGISSIDAIKQLFMSSPNKQWRGDELKIHFNKMLLDGVIKTKSRNITALFYSSLDYLIKTNFISKNGTGKKAIYKAII